MFLLSVQNSLKVLRVICVGQCNFKGQNASADFFGKRLLHSPHPDVGTGLDEGFYLVRFAFLDAVPNRRVGEKYLGGDRSAAVRSWYELLGTDAHKNRGELDTHLLLLVGREDVDDSVDGLRRILSMERGKNEVSCFRCRDGGRDRFEVAHFADENDVGILAEHPLERLGEALRVDADLPLVDDALVRDVNVLDRVFDGDDVLSARGIDHLEYCGKRGAFSVSRRAGDEEEASAVRGNLFEGRWEPEFIECSNAHGDETKRKAESSRLVIGVSAEASFFSRWGPERKAEVVLAALSEHFHLLGLQKMIQRILHVPSRKWWLSGDSMQFAVDTKFRRKAFAHMEVARPSRRYFSQKIVDLQSHRPQFTRMCCSKHLQHWQCRILSFVCPLL